MKHQVLAYNQGPFIVDRGITNEVLEQEMSMRIDAVLKYRENSNVIGTQLNLCCSVSGKDVIIYGFILTIGVDGWMKSIQGKNEEEIRKVSMPIWDTVIGFARGALAVQLKDDVNKIFIPWVDIQEFSICVAIEKLMD